MSKIVDLRQGVTLEQIDGIVADILNLANSLRIDTEIQRRRWERMEQEAELALVQCELNRMESVVR